MNTGKVLFANNATSRLYASIDAVTTSIRVSAGDGNKFPQPAGDGSNWFMVTLEDRRNNTVEICKCTGRSGDILNVQRGQETSTAKAFEFGANVSNRMTAGMMAQFFQFNGYSMAESDAKFVDAAGDTMTGPLLVPTPPTAPTQAASKQYVDDVSIDDVLHDGVTYSRKDGTWVPAAGGVSEAPVNAKPYARQDANWIETVGRVEFDATATDTSNALTDLDDRVTGTETVNTTQDNRLTSVEGVNSSQDSRLTAVESKNTTQDGRLTAVEGANASQDTAIAGKQSLSEKGQVNGYASLDASAKVPAVQLPAYVDDVLEFANLAAFPATGTVGIIYVALDTNRVYRWGGSSYTEISPSPGSTDAVPEGSVNKYYTDARAQAANAAAIALKANIASPTFTGNPAAPTPTAGDNDTSIATTQFVQTAIGNRPTDAPSDTNAYGRKAGAWVDVAEESPADGITYGRKNGAWVASIGGATVGDAPPAPPLVQGQLFFESDTGITYIWFDDGNTTQWVQIAGPQASQQTDYVRKSGDTMTGSLTVSGVASYTLNSPGDGAALTLSGGAAYNTGANIELYGPLSSLPNEAYYDAAKHSWRVADGTASLMTLSNTGGLNVSGTITATGVSSTFVSGSNAFIGAGSAIVLAPTTTGGVYFRPGGPANSSTQSFFNSAGDLSLYGGVLNPGPNLVMAASGGGAIYLRPNGLANATGNLTISGNGAVGVNGPLVFVGGGIQSKQGISGAAAGNQHNFYYASPNIQVWVDNTNFGNMTISCDYRIKKDVVPLNSMWDTVKGMRPVSYTQAEFTPPSALKEDVEGEPTPPMFPADNIPRWGFIAHEIQQDLLLTAAAGIKDAPDQIQSLNLAPIVAALTKALQEAMARIEALEAARV